MLPQRAIRLSWIRTQKVSERPEYKPQFAHPIESTTGTSANLASTSHRAKGLLSKSARRSRSSNGLLRPRRSASFENQSGRIKSSQFSATVSRSGLVPSAIGSAALAKASQRAATFQITVFLSLFAVLMQDIAHLLKGSLFSARQKQWFGLA